MFYELVKCFVCVKFNNLVWEIDIEIEYGDYYIDFLCVDEVYCGKGIGMVFLNVVK